MKYLRNSLIVLGFIVFTVVFFAGIIALLIVSLDQNWSLISPYISACVTFLVGVSGIVSANIIATKWREQHNKKLANDFGLDVYKEFEALEKNILDHRTLLTEFESSYHKKNITLLEKYKLLKNMAKDDRIKELQNTNPIQDSFNLLFNKLRNYSIVTNRGIRFHKDFLALIDKFEAIYNTDIELDNANITESLFEHLNNRIDQIYVLKEQIYRDYIHNILSNLRS
ncbi:hypothetical protein [Acinetobacter pollinis]|uniref:hypothetical protein n=1 Tax=Acinetobacter pollinis TaxID=2605270 RepID=UPI0018C24236|nr:hypothetical protein [Acinetobacter pollinis]MBF7694261.1 hypothetical protein [Acinetobacter pollinis]MBF7700893.1 hypothetical protein [Acinetobacter pollinis]